VSKGVRYQDLMENAQAITNRRMTLVLRDLDKQLSNGLVPEDNWKGKLETLEFASGNLPLTFTGVFPADVWCLSHNRDGAYVSLPRVQWHRVTTGYTLDAIQDLPSGAASTVRLFIWS